MSVGEDEVHRLPAVTEDERRLAGRDALHPADQHLGVEAVDVHPRPVHVEVAQGHVVEAVHRVEAAQHALVEDLGRAVERVVVVRVVAARSSGTRSPGRRPTPTRRRPPCARSASTAASSTLNVPSASTSSASRGSSAHCVMRIAAWWKTRSVPAVASRTTSRSRMSPSMTCDPARGQGLGEVLLAPAHEVVEDAHLGRARLDELVDDRGPDRAGAAGHQAHAARRITRHVRSNVTKAPSSSQAPRRGLEHAQDPQPGPAVGGRGPALADGSRRTRPPRRAAPPAPAAPARPCRPSGRRSAPASRSSAPSSSRRPPVDAAVVDREPLARVQVVPHHACAASRR